MPGIPLSASTQRPESSSDHAGSPVKSAIACAFSKAFSAKVAPVSATSGAPGNSVRLASATSTWPAARMRVSSSSLCWFAVARTSRGRSLGCCAGHAPSAACWIFVSSAHPATPEVEQFVQQLAVERLALGGPLNLDEPASIASADHCSCRSPPRRPRRSRGQGAAAPSTMPTLTAATDVVSGSPLVRLRSFSQAMASTSATYPPVIAAVRVAAVGLGGRRSR